MDLAGSGSLSLGGTLTATTSGAASGTTFTFLSAGKGSAPALGGVAALLVALRFLLDARRGPAVSGPQA